MNSKKLKERIRDTEKFAYCRNICPHLDRYNGWCNYHYKDDSEIDYNTCEENKG